MTVQADKNGKRELDEGVVDIKEILQCVRRIDGRTNTLSKDTASMKDSLKELHTEVTSIKQDLSSVKRSVEVVKIEQLRDRQALASVQRELGNVQKILGGDYRNHPYTVARLLRQRFFFVKSFRATEQRYGQQVQETVSYLTDLFKDLGISLPADIFKNVSLEKYSATAVKKNAALADKQMVVVTLPDTKFLGVLGSVKQQMMDKHGIIWRVELTPAEQADRKKIISSAAFQKACGKLPKGQKPVWRFDKVILGQGSDAEVWTAQRAEQLEQSAEPERVDMTD